MYVSFYSSATSSIPSNKANMKVITAIYLNCRPDLRDEWLTGNEIEEGQGAQVSLSQVFLTLYVEQISGSRTSPPPPRKVLCVEFHWENFYYMIKFT